MSPITSPAIVEIPASELERVFPTLVLAFGADPMARWSWPDPQRYFACFSAMLRGFASKGTIHCVTGETGGCAAAAVWMPPGVEPDEAALDQAMREGVPPARQSEVAAVVEQMGLNHPREPHWHLPLIGVDPVHQHRGLGSALLRHALARCDREHLPAYLESSNPANIPLYERHGFRRMGVIQVGSSPELVPMFRAAR
jgi:ribosomal protein S18 acetylase RimI-like enzyme